MTEQPIDDLLDELETRVAETYYENTEDEMDEPPLARSYSFTALSTAMRCPREYVYTYVLGLPTNLGTARDGDTTETADDKGGEEPRPVREGRLFHTVVEHQWPRSTDPDEWKDYASKLAAAREWGDALPRVERLIESFFESPVSEWGIDADRVEVSFSFDFWGRTISGHIDSLPRGSEDDAVVLDFKTGAHDPDEDQLLLYVLATHRDEHLDVTSPATKAAFFRVDEDDRFSLEWLDFDESESMLEEAEDVLKTWVRAAEGATLDDPSPGTHCTSCAYRGICDAADRE